LLAWDAGELPVARDLLTDSVAVARACAAATELADALNELGAVLRELGEYTVGLRCLEESATVARTAENRRTLALALMRLASVLRFAGDPTAMAVLEEGLALARETSSWMAIGPILNCLGEWAREDGEYARALAHYEEAYASVREHRSYLTALVLSNLAFALLGTGQVDRAEAAFAESLTMSRELGLRLWATGGIAGLGAVAAARGHHQRAARLVGAAEALTAAMGLVLYGSDRIAYDRTLAAARVALGEEAFAAALAAGQVLSLEQATAEALQAPTSGTTTQPLEVPPRSEQPAPATRVQNPDGLTDRELEVLRLLAKGATSAEIAAQLVLSIRTVHRHIANIYAKINARGRADAVAYAIRHKLIPS
jgi:non-specific serine/threonine protein kinase